MYLWFSLLAGQFVFQLLLLIAVLSHACKHDEDAHMRSVFVRAFTITLCTVLFEAWLFKQHGGLVIVPSVGITALVLMNANWKAMWTSCLCVLLSSATFILIAFAVTPRDTEAPDINGIEEADAPAARQQVSVNPNPAEPSVSEAPQLSTPPADLRAAQHDGSAPKHTGILKGGKWSRTDEQRWQKARSTVKFQGSIRARTKEPVLHINGNVYRIGDVLEITHEGFSFRWIILNDRGGSLDLKRLGLAPDDSE